MLPETAFGEARHEVGLAVETVMRLRDQVHDCRVHTQRIAGFTQRAARPVGGHRGGQRRSVASVLRVEMLDDLLAPLVLEVYVDVRWLAAFAGNEALKEQVAACRVDLGDAEAVADRRVGGGTPALAQDALRSREPLRFFSDECPPFEMG